MEGGTTSFIALLMDRKGCLSASQAPSFHGEEKFGNEGLRDPEAKSGW